jgi:hypothetical protein
MAQYNTKEFSCSLAKAFLDEIFYQKSRNYYTLGRVNDWGVSDVPSESATLTPEYLDDVRRELAFVKRISPNEVSLVVPRIDWISGTVYDQWDHTQVMYTKSFYVITDEFKVYKCLNNNNAIPSTQKPTSTDVAPFTTADGYLWKYLYTVPSFKRTRFMTLDYMPVQRSISESFYGVGEIESVSVVTGGEGYTEATTSIVVFGDGEGAVISPVIYDGAIVDVVIENGGTGYTNATLTVLSTSGTGAALTANISRTDFESDQIVVEQSALSQKGAIYSIVVQDEGDNYTDFTTITIQGNGEGCVIEPVIESGKIKQLLVLNPGIGYTYANIIITDPGRPIIPPEEQASAYAILPPDSGHGADATRELYASTVAVITSLRNELEIQAISQEFRTFGILQSPRNVYTGAEYTKQTEILAYKTVFLNADNLVKDEVLLFGNDRFRVLEISGTTVHLIPLDKGSVVPVGNLVAQNELAREYTSQVATNLVELDKYTGKLIYFSESTPFEFTEDQSITVKTYMKF